MIKKLRLFIIIVLLIPLRVVYAEEFQIDSKNAVLFNLNNNEIIYEKSKDEIIKVASMQKIMTSIVAIENIENLDEEFYIESLDGLDPELLVVGFYPGELVTYKDLLYGTLLKSGADGAYLLAIKIAGSEEAYASLMNEKAKELGLENTNFINSHGLDDDNQYSTVYDIGLIMKYAMNNKYFREIISTPEYTTSDGEFNFSGPAKKAKDLGMDYFIGGKTGYTSGARSCLVSVSSKDNVDYLLVTAGANEYIDDLNFDDQKKVYEYYMNNYSFKDVIRKDDLIINIKTKYGEDVIIKQKKTVNKYIKNAAYESGLKPVYKGKKVLNKEIKKGDVIGKYTISYDNEIIYEEIVKSPITVRFYLKKEYRIGLFILVSIFVLIEIIRLYYKIRRRKRKYIYR